MDLSICLVSFNTCDILDRTVRAALADTSDLTAEVIVVDNGSGDGSIEMLRQNFPMVRVIANPENRFFAEAINQAMALSGGRYVLALNSDAEVVPGTLAGLVGYLDSHPAVGAATTRMFFPDGRLQRTCARFWTFELLLLEYTFLGLLLPVTHDRLRRDARYADWDRLSERPVDVAPGSFILARRGVLSSIGGFDERLHLYFTDDDWCLRLQQTGLKVMYKPIGGVIHPEGASTHRIRAQARQMYFEDMLAYTAKHFGISRRRWLSVLTWPTRWGLTAAARLRGE